MSYVIDDLQKYKRKLNFLALGDLILIIISLAVALLDHYFNLNNGSIFFWVLFGIFTIFMLLIGAERLELNNHKPTKD